MAFAGQFNPQLLAALQRQQQPQVPQLSTGPTRSALVAQALQQQAARRPQQVGSVGEGLARLGSELIGATTQRRLIDEQLQAQEQQQKAQSNLIGQALAGNQQAGANLLSVNPQLGLALLARQDDAAQRRRVEAQRQADLAQEQEDERVKAAADQQEREAKLQAATAKAEKQRFDSVSGLRKEASQVTKDFRAQKAAIQRIRDVSFDAEGNLKQSPASSLALVFNFMKVLDPGSVVRESEFRTAEQARGALSRLEGAGVTVPAAVQQAVQRLEGEGTLLPEQIRDFNEQAEAIFMGARSTALDDISPLVQAAKANEFELNRIFSESLLEDLEAPQEALLSDEELLRRLGVGQ